MQAFQRKNPIAHCGMLGLFAPKNDNAWTASDRRERLKVVLTLLLAIGALSAGVGLLIVGLATP